MGTKYSYIGQQYSQGNSELTLVSFCANASDIYDWGGVPSKNEQFHGGFQRALSARYRKIIQFFNTSQASPGAIVVAFRQGALQMTDLGQPPAWPKPDELTTSARFVHLSFETEDDSKLSLPELISRVRTLLEQRPGFSATEEVPEELEEPDDVEVEASLDAEAPSTDEDENEDDLDVGQSKLRSFYNFIGDEEAVSKWLHAETEKINQLKTKKSQTQADREYISVTAEERLRFTLTSLIRPAMIVDGQHRVNGATESETENIVFTVCAIKDADWVEQVFQFVVLNKMAKPISKDFLTELLNTSLTNAEIGDIDGRLETIGIKNADRKIHKFINYDPRSPFAGLVAEAGEVVGVDTSGKLSQQGMLRIARRWRAIGGPGKTAEMNCFLPYLNAATLTEGRKKWESYETWMALFFAFWEEVRDLYEPQHMWVKQEKYHLLYIVTLQALQDHFLEAKALGQAKFTNMEDFRKQVREFFKDVPSGFFMNWSATGLQSGSGWDYIKKAIAMFQNGAHLPKVQKESELFSS